MADRGNTDLLRTGPDSIQDVIKFHPVDTGLNPTKTQGRRLSALMLDIVDTLDGKVERLSSNTLRDSPYSYVGPVSSQNVAMGEFGESNTIDGVLGAQEIPGTYNYFGAAFIGNSLSGEFSNNTIGAACSNNVFGPSAIDNHIGNGANGNSFGDEFQYNKISPKSYQNIIGSNFKGNTAGNFFEANAIGSYCLHNVFGNNFYSNTLGDTVDNCTFSTDVHHCIIGSACSYIRFTRSSIYVQVGDNCQDVTIIGCSGQPGALFQIPANSSGVTYKNNQLVP